MKNTIYSIKVVFISIMAVAGIARNCVKTTVRVADTTQPVWTNTRNVSKTYNTNDEVLRQALRVADLANDAAQMGKPIQEMVRNDTVKIMLKPMMVDGK